MAEQETIAKGEAWCVLVGQLTSRTSRVEVLRQGAIAAYPLSPREPFERFSLPVSLDVANRYLADNPWAGCTTVDSFAKSQPGLLAVFSGEFGDDISRLEGKCIVNDLPTPSYSNWDLVATEIPAKDGTTIQVFHSTVQLLSAHPRFTTTVLEDLEGRTFISDVGEERPHSPADYARDLLYDLPALLTSRTAYLDLATRVEAEPGRIRWE
jgi:hypothetical protein